jgi:hypothetical protein
LVRDHDLDSTSVIAAVDLLAEEGKVIREKSGGHLNPYDGIRIYPLWNGQ